MSMTVKIPALSTVYASLWPSSGSRATMRPFPSLSLIILRLREDERGLLLVQYVKTPRPGLITIGGLRRGAPNAFRQPARQARSP